MHFFRNGLKVTFAIFEYVNKQAIPVILRYHVFALFWKMFHRFLAPFEWIWWFGSYFVTSAQIAHAYRHRSLMFYWVVRRKGLGRDWIQKNFWSNHFWSIFWNFGRKWPNFDQNRDLIFDHQIECGQSAVLYPETSRHCLSISARKSIPKNHHLNLCQKHEFQFKKT